MEIINILCAKDYTRGSGDKLSITGGISRLSLHIEMFCDSEYLIRKTAIEYKESF